eukprot:2599740-Rhodomonas_salina.1
MFTAPKDYNYVVSNLLGTFLSATSLYQDLARALQPVVLCSGIFFYHSRISGRSIISHRKMNSCSEFVPRSRTCRGTSCTVFRDIFLPYLVEPKKLMGR